ncbi:MAG TPA: type II secretion system protein [Syntrophales bacterium]|nr:type II secretion system protein [Syntrophales bacterium]
MSGFRRFHGEDGFSLVELIVTLVIAAILGTLLVVYMGTGITKSGIPVIWVKQEFTVFKVMERVTADYQAALKTTPFNLATFASQIDTATKVNARYGSDIDSSTVVSTAFPADGGTETGTDPNIIKVTLRKGDQSVTALFTQ